VDWKRVFTHRFRHGRGISNLPITIVRVRCVGHIPLKG